ncbi:MFS transporter [Cohnella massiliensis]|uniref:MFS transporter n=1 Tax=Cohnella massiliensis TaxID=1816691 RepID=UPI0015949AA9|nr:MFS transporter [Cohnella massiliensis]
MSIAVRLRGFNIGFFSLFALFISFLPVYASQIGISKTEIGLILGIGSLISIVSQPLWGIVCDRTRTIKKVMLLILTVSVIAGTLLFQSREAWLFALFVAMMNLFFMPSDALVESLNVQTAQRVGISYGSIRTFGALGYAFTSLAAGTFLHAFGMGSLAWIFLGFGLVTLLLGLSMSDVKASSKPIAFGQLKTFMLDPRMLAFFALVFLVALPHKMNDMYIGLYIEEMGGNVRHTGMAWFAMTLSEALFFALSAKLIKPGKELAVMAVSAGMYLVRFGLSSLVTEPLPLVAMQVFQGVTFALFYVAAIQYLHSIVPEQWKSTGQTVMTVLFFGISGIVGSSAGGWLMERLGGQSLYRIMAALAAVAFVYGFYLWKKRLRPSPADA